MTSDFLLDWAALAVSIINSILLLWLGITVLINSERRSLAIWLAGIGLLMGSLFFLSHTVILGMGSLQPSNSMNLWWRTGWIPVLCMPLAWYLVMLWYSSYWDDPHSLIRQRHQVPLVLSVLLAVSVIGLAFLFNALPSYSQSVDLDLGGVLSIGGIPVMMVVYPFYLVLCMGFSVDVLLHPGTPARLMGQLARERARPWLLFATLTLFLVSLAVGGIILWGVLSANQAVDPHRFALTITSFDLVIDVLIIITILTLGQAIASYEVFTGKVLPRQGLKRTWISAIFIALIFGVLVSWAIIKQLEAIYVILLMIVLFTGIFAFLVWRSFIDQENYLKTLRPFITSEHLYDRLLLRDSSSIDFDITKPFHALCRDILNVKQAYLIPMGIFGPLVGDGIAYPTENGSIAYDELLAEIHGSLAAASAFAPILLADSKLFSHNSIAISLWSERGLVGALVLGERFNGSLFTQEEIEISRMLGERLIDRKASAELTHRLMDLQRQHISQTRLVDQQTRRSLHDDVLPKLQSTMIRLASQAIGTDEAVREMSEIHHQLTVILHELPSHHEPEVARRGLIEALKVTIESEYRPFFNSLTWQIDDQVSGCLGSIPPYASDVLYHATREAVRNAAHHGRQSEADPPINLIITIIWNNRIIITVQDDGRGFDSLLIDREHIGQGLALHSTLLAVVGGSLAIDSIAGEKTQVTLKLPA